MARRFLLHVLCSASAHHDTTNVIENRLFFTVLHVQDPQDPVDAAQSKEKQA